MWIVLLEDNTRHSAWMSKAAALTQVDVLRANGYYRDRHAPPDYRQSRVLFDATTRCDDGFYYV